MSEGYGCDVYIEATGNGASVQQGLDVIARQGRFVVFSVFKGDVLADWSLIGMSILFKTKVSSEVWVC